METTIAPKYPLHTLIKAIEILQYINNNKSNRITLNTLSKELGLSKSSTHRILDTLLYYNFVEKTDGPIVYYGLGWNAYRLGAYVPSSHTLENCSYALEADELSSKLNVHVNVNAQRNNLVIVIYNGMIKKEKAEKSFFTEFYPMYATASGKLLMLNYSESDIVNYFEKTDIIKYTENTILNYIDFIEALSEIRKKDYAIDQYEYSEDKFCVAVPIYDYMDNVVASLSITSHMPFEKDILDMYLKELTESCKRLSSYLGSTHLYPDYSKTPV